jgi:hypothetical protein
MLDWSDCGNWRKLGLRLLVCECEGESIESKLCSVSVRCVCVCVCVCVVDDTEGVLVDRESDVAVSDAWVVMRRGGASRTRWGPQERRRRIGSDREGAVRGCVVATTASGESEGGRGSARECEGEEERGRERWYSDTAITEDEGRKREGGRWW